jgi:hypothetical protein
MSRHAKCDGEDDRMADAPVEQQDYMKEDGSDKGDVVIHSNEYNHNVPTYPKGEFNVLDAERRITALKSVLKARASEALTPYQPEAWLHFLKSLSLILKYAPILNGLRFGFMGSVPTISRTYTPPNSPSIRTHQEAVATILDREYFTTRYLAHYLKQSRKTQWAVSNSSTSNGSQASEASEVQTRSKYFLSFTPNCYNIFD